MTPQEYNNVMKAGKYLIEVLNETPNCKTAASKVKSELTRLDLEYHNAMPKIDQVISACVLSMALIGVITILAI